VRKARYPVPDLNLSGNLLAVVVVVQGGMPPHWLP